MVSVTVSDALKSGHAGSRSVTMCIVVFVERAIIVCHETYDMQQVVIENFAVCTFSYQRLIAAGVSLGQCLGISQRFPGIFLSFNFSVVEFCVVGIDIA